MLSLSILPRPSKGCISLHLSISFKIIVFHAKISKKVPDESKINNEFKRNPKIGPVSFRDVAGLSAGIFI